MRFVSKMLAIRIYSCRIVVGCGIEDADWCRLNAESNLLHNRKSILHLRLRKRVEVPPFVRQLGEAGGFHGVA